MMYHIGKVVQVITRGKEVLSADDSVQVVTEMWDKNILTLLVSPKLAKKVKKETYVLVDYRPVSNQIPVPRHLVVKILKGKKGEAVWKQYKSYLAEKQKKKTPPATMTPQYFG